MKIFNSAQASTRTTLSEAKKFAAKHRQIDPDTLLIKFFPHVSKIRFLEVSNAVVGTGEILPFHFVAQPACGAHYPQILILISPNEWQDIQDGKLTLPTGWDLGTAVDL